MTTMTRVQNLFQNGLFMMMKTGVVILVSFLVSTHRERLLKPITSPLSQSGFVLPGPARSLDWERYAPCLPTLSPLLNEHLSHLAVKVIEELRSLTDQLSGLSNSALGRILASVPKILHHIGFGEEKFAITVSVLEGKVCHWSIGLYWVKPSEGFVLEGNFVILASFFASIDIRFYFLFCRAVEHFTLL